MTIALQERERARLRSWLPAILVLCAFATLTAVQIVLCHRYPTDYDEGVYLQTLRAVGAGFEPYREVFLAQPPFLADAALPFFDQFGTDVFAARFVIVIFWVAAVAGMYAVGTLSSTRFVGVLAAALLALDPIFLTAGHTLQPEVPAIALAIWSVAAGLHAVRHDRPVFAGLCGALFALAIATKFLVAPVLVPLLVIALRQRPFYRRLGLAALAGAAATSVLVLGRFTAGLSAFYDQAIRFHHHAQSVYGGNHSARFDVWLTTLNDPLIGAAIIGFGIELVLRGRANLLPLSWFGATAASLLTVAPLWGHHFAALSAAACLLLATLIGGAARWSKQCVAIALTVMTVAAGFAAVTAFEAKNPYPRWVLSQLEQVTAGEKYIVTDDQFLAAELGVSVPPELVDTSLVRIQTGYLTVTEATAAMQRHQTTVVVLASGRLRTVPGFGRWVRTSCRQVSGLLVVQAFSCPSRATPTAR